MYRTGLGRRCIRDLEGESAPLEEGFESLLVKLRDSANNCQIVENLGRLEFRREILPEMGGRFKGNIGYFEELDGLDPQSLRPAA